MKFLRTTWNHIRRSPYQAFAAIFIIMQTFFIASIFIYVVYGSAQIIHYFESLPQATAFFTNEAKDGNIRALEDRLKSTGKIAKMHYVSKQDALSIYQRMFKDDPLLLQFVTADILPASLEISTTKIEDLEDVTRTLKDSSIVKEVIFPQDIISNLRRWTNALRKMGVILFSALALDSIFLMIILIGIKIAQRKDEIEIMRLLGATSWYVRWPFIFEGILYGVIGAFLGWVLATGVLWYAIPFLTSFLGNIPVFPISPLLFGELFVIEFSVAVCLGIFSSFMAVLRYLK